VKLAIALGVVVAGCGEPAQAPDGAPIGGIDAAVDAPTDARIGAPPLRRLSSTGLYSDFDARVIAPGLIEFTPRYALWSDGARKRRWLSLPTGSTIDTSDPAHWRFPVGTRVWKEFSAPDGRLLETRLIERVSDSGDDEVDYWMGAFVWLDDESDAIYREEGAEDVRGTAHDVPAAIRCPTCHYGEPGHLLGVSTLQLSGAGEGARLAELAYDGRLGAAPPAEYTVPGDDVTRAALGYLHANCGHCHNQRGAARPYVDMTLQLDLVATTPEDTTIWQNTVGVPLFSFQDPGYTVRVAPGDPAASALLHRMMVRGPRQQMPPIATEVVDDTGVAAVRQWIGSLAPPP